MRECGKYSLHIIFHSKHSNVIIGYTLQSFTNFRKSYFSFLNTFYDTRKIYPNSKNLHDFCCFVALCVFLDQELLWTFWRRHFIRNCGSDNMIQTFILSPVICILTLSRINKCKQGMQWGKIAQNIVGSTHK